jgi:predicted DsbA family dithiol-disulfide isomerase
VKRAPAIAGAFLTALGALSVVEALRLRDDRQGAQKMGIHRFPRFVLSGGWYRALTQSKAR